MALWQFITFTVLIGALLVYLSVITRRLGSTDARLNRIEAALLATSRSIDSADARAAEARPEVSGAQEGRGDYLTIRDLRQLSSRTSRSSSGNTGAVLDRRESPKTTHDPMGSPRATPARGGSVAVASENGEARKASDEQLSSYGRRPFTVDAVQTSLESRDAPATNGGATTPPAGRLPIDDSVARKNRDMTLFLNNQRRRRRARLGY